MYIPTLGIRAQCHHLSELRSMTESLTDFDLITGGTNKAEVLRRLKYKNNRTAKQECPHFVACSERLAAQDATCGVVCRLIIRPMELLRTVQIRT